MNPLCDLGAAPVERAGRPPLESVAEARARYLRDPDNDGAAVESFEEMVGRALAVGLEVPRPKSKPKPKPKPVITAAPPPRGAAPPVPTPRVSTVPPQPNGRWEVVRAALALGVLVAAVVVAFLLLVSYGSH